MIRLRSNSRGLIRPIWKPRIAGRAFCYAVGRKGLFEARIARYRVPMAARRLATFESHRAALAEGVKVWHYTQLPRRHRRRARRHLRRTYRRYPHSRGVLASIASPVGMGNDGQKAYDMATRTWYGTLVGNLLALNKPWVDVTNPTFLGGAKGDGITDDTNAILAAIAYLATQTNSGILYFPPGIYLVSNSLILGTKVHVWGAGRQISILKGAAAFGGVGGVIRGVLEYRGTGTTILVDNQIAHLGFDLTATTDQQVEAIHQSAAGGQQSAMQHANFFDLWFDLGVTSNIGHGGIFLEGLGSSTNNTVSFDITGSDLYARNGGALMVTMLNGFSAASLYRGVSIQNTHSLIDSDQVGDDRIAILGNYTSGAGGNATVRDVSVRGTWVEIAANVTVGTINGCKYDCGQNTYLKNIAFRDTFFTNLSTIAVFGLAPVVGILTGATSTAQNILVDHVEGFKCGRIKIVGNRAETSPFWIARHINLEQNQDATVMLEFFITSAPSGDETILVDGFDLYTTAALAGNVPVAIGFMGSAGSGVSGVIGISNGTLRSQIGISNNVSEAGGIAATSYTRIRIRAVNFGSVTPVNFAAGTDAKAVDCPGYSNAGVVGIAVTASPFTWTNNRFRSEAVYISGGTVTTVAKNAVTVFSHGGTAADDTVWLEPLETVTVTYTVAPTMNEDIK